MVPRPVRCAMRGEWIKAPTNGTAVVFVHGILSSGETCWTHENGAYWPRLLAEEASLGDFGIYVFTYQTGVFSGSYSIGDAVDALKEHMRLDGVLDNHQLIFVCHSMGGIVVRKFVVERAIDLLNSRKKIGLFLVASPSLGSSYADWFSMLARFMGHSHADSLRFIRGNTWLADLDREFRNLKEDGKLWLKGKELVEDKFVLLSGFWRRQVVEPFAGARYFGEPFKVPASDHFSIAKPIGSEAIQNRLLCRFIADHFSRAMPAQTVQSQPASPAALDSQPPPPDTPEERPKLLLGIALDTSGSMKKSILNTSFEDVSRFDSVTAALTDLGSQMRDAVSQQGSDNASDFRVFVYGFGLRIGEGVCDLASLWRAAQKIDLPREIERKRADFEDRDPGRAATFRNLGSLAGKLGYGDIAKTLASIPVIADVSEKLMSTTRQIGDSTLTARELAELFESSSATSNTDMIRHAIFGDTWMVRVANEIFHRFSREGRVPYGQRTLVVISDGAPSDGDPRPGFAAIREIGVDIIACFVTDADIADPRVLLGAPNTTWPSHARLMWDIASPVSRSSAASEYLVTHGWRIEENARLFVQVNHSDVLSEFLRVAGCNISGQVPSLLPRGQ